MRNVPFSLTFLYIYYINPLCHLEEPEFCHHVPLCGPLTFRSVLTIWSPGVASLFGECRVCFRTALCAQKVYVAWKIISIFSEFVSKSSQKCRTLSQKCGKEGKMGDFSHHNCMSRTLIGNNCPIKSITHWLGIMHMQTLYTNKDSPRTLVKIGHILQYQF